MKKWLENYFYHYKWQTLIALVFIVTFAVGISQVAVETKSYDVNVLYAGTAYLQKSEHDKIAGVIKKAATDTAEALGENEYSAEDKKVNFQMMVYQSEARIAELKEEYKARGEEYTYDPMENKRVFTTFQNQLISGDTVIMILDPELYGSAADNGALYTVDEILAREVKGVTDDGFGIVIGESGLLEKYPEFSVIPENSVICFKKITHAMKIIGKSRDNNAHKFQLSVAVMLFDGVE